LLYKNRHRDMTVIVLINIAAESTWSIFSSVK
jgi:hypothetical protein